MMVKLFNLLDWKSDSAEKGLGFGGASGAPNNGGAGANPDGRSDAVGLLETCATHSSNTYIIIIT